ncbi:zinc metalloproteinase [Diaporthe amygdali]|uniref:zinc metalloproteinase n=1 Tax=Phomopsis amygdali TaxID=1214568 RepID=UPI0022FE3743|nr:zinc metalloproteinase [Diaporthe amygdali]KAJ0120753.1 zinc metalloproteinase [Diaporthe amygdali]
MESTSQTTSAPILLFENVEEGEVIYQRCLIIKARYTPVANAPATVTIEHKSPSGDELYPTQTWPVAEGHTKIIAMLSPGFNTLVVQPNGRSTEKSILNLTYLPLMQQPPLHLAVMVADDSPLSIDYEPNNAYPNFAANASLDSAMSRFRMLAYMWQAMIAEDMRMKGLGRRSFRLDEQWGVDTTSARFSHALRDARLWEAGAARSTAKIHILKSTHTTKDIRNAKISQDNVLARNKARLHAWFEEALQASGQGIFLASARPIVAGLILDSTYDHDASFVLGHAAMGSHNATGTSLCVFGSHLAYSWPRNVEDITPFLVDPGHPQDGTVSIANTTTGAMWEICSIGQADFLHQLGHAFGASHMTGIMRGACAQHWPRNFVARTAPNHESGEEGSVVIDGETVNEATWDLKNALAFTYLPHFRLPSDRPFPVDEFVARFAKPAIFLDEGTDEEGNHELQLKMSSPVGIFCILWNGEPSEPPSLTNPLFGARTSLKQIEANFDRDQPVRLAVLARNGKETIVPDVWTLFEDPCFIRIPGSDVILHKRSVMCKDLEEGVQSMQDKRFWTWATLLTKRMQHGTIVGVKQIDICVTCVLEGVYVRFQDGIRVNCGPRVQKSSGGKFNKHFRGHVPQELMIPPNQEILGFEVARDAQVLRGLRVRLSNGESKGAVCRGGLFEERCILEPPIEERIIGLYGRNHFGEESDGMVELGIITVRKDANLPYEEADFDRDDDPYAAPDVDYDSSEESDSGESEDADLLLQAFLELNIE